MKRLRKPLFAPERIAPASVVDFRVTRKIGSTVEIDLVTPVPMSDAVETGREIAFVRARRAGWPDLQAVRLADQVALYLSQSVQQYLDGACCEEKLASVGPSCIRELDADDDLPF